MTILILLCSAATVCEMIVAHHRYKLSKKLLKENQKIVEENYFLKGKLEQFSKDILNFSTRESKTIFKVQQDLLHEFYLTSRYMDEKEKKNAISSLQNLEQQKINVFKQILQFEDPNIKVHDIATQTDTMVKLSKYLEDVSKEEKLPIDKAIEYINNIVKEEDTKEMDRVSKVFTDTGVHYVFETTAPKKEDCH
jgi:hypothetical protein